MANNNQNVTLRTIGIAVGTLILVYLFSSLIAGGRVGYGYNMNYGIGYGLGLSGLLSSMLILIIKILWLVLVVSIVAGIAVVIKKQVLDEKKLSLNIIEKLFASDYACQECGTKIRSEYKFCPSCKSVLNYTCVKCGGNLKAGWKCCPSCGTDANSEALAQN